MSYTVWMIIDTGGKKPISIVDSINYTSNVSGMWEKALGFSLRELNGKLGLECIKSLTKAVKHMKENPSIYKPMNPSNRWGCYTNAMQFLRDILKWCRNNPKATLKMWY